jgi:cell division protein FtsZ
MAISSPLLEASIDGAHGVLLSISGGSDLGLFEINEAAQLVQTAAHPEANIIFGAVIDDALGDEVRVTVIAAGFDSGSPKRTTARPAEAGVRAGTNGTNGHRPAVDRPTVSASASASEPGMAPTGPTPPAPGQRQPVREPATVGAAAEPGSIRLPHDEPARTASRPARTIVFDDADELDVPDFLK